MPLTPDALRLAEKRYFNKNEKQECIEGWDGLANRVVNFVCQDESPEFKKKAYNLIYSTKFLPNTPCLVNAGNPNGTNGLSACYVTKAPADTWKDIVKNIERFGDVARAAGGCGVCFSNIRPEGSPVFGSAHTKACGPIEAMRMVSEAMSSITQSGIRGMACLTYDTMVSTENGFIPIGEIVEKNLIGTKIHTQFGNAVIENAWCNGEKEVFEIITQRGHKIKVTGDHLVYVIENFTSKNHTRLAKNVNKIGVWKKVSELDIENDSLVLNMDEKPFGKKYQYVNGIKLDENLAALISYTKCDGSLTKRKSYDLLQLSLDSQESVQFFTTQSFSDLQINTKPQTGAGGITKLQKAGSDVSFLTNFGEFYTYQCDIPNEIFASPKSVISSFLKSAFDAEGTVDVSNNRCRIIIGMTSIKFMEGIQILLGMFGINSSLRRDVIHVNKDGRYRHNMNYLSITNKFHVKKFMEEIGFFSSKKNASANKAISNMKFGTGKGKSSWNKIIHKISSICTMGYQTVYDISTSNQTFLANNIVVHNCMSTLHVHHPDIIKFIQCKQKPRALKTLLKEDILNHYESLSKNASEDVGILLDKFISNFNISVIVNNEFMEAVKNDEDWNLTFNGKIYETVKARVIFKLIAENAWKNGDPGLIFEEALNSGPYKYSKQIIDATNPCVVKGSLVATQQGWIPVEDVKVGDLIWSRNKLVPVDEIEVNNNYDIYRVTFTDGDYVDATSSHRFKCVVAGKYEYLRLDEIKEEETKVLLEPINIDLMEQHEIITETNIKLLQEEYHENFGLLQSPRDLGIIIGTVIGAGCSVYCKSKYNVKIDFEHLEWKSGFQKLLNKYSIKNNSENNQVVSNVLGHLEILGFDVRNKIIPENIIKSNNSQLLIGLLDGLFSSSSNLSIKKYKCINEYVPMLQFSSSKYELCRQIRRILLCFGIHSTIDQKYVLTIMMGGINQFHQKITLSNLNKENKINKCIQQYYSFGGTWTSTVQSIEKLEGKHTVYDLYNKQTDEWNVNGYIQQGCGEQPLPHFCVCNLGSLDISKYFKKSEHFYNDFNNINWNALKSDIHTAVQFLDNVVSANKYPNKDFEECAMKNRPIGLGIMGWADLLLKMHIEYGSQESLELAEKLAEFLETESHKKSVQLGKERGTPDACKYEELEYRRNVTLTSIAPTGSISLLAGCSSSIEPIFSPTIYRYDNTGHYVQPHPSSDEEWFKCAIDKEKNGKREVTPEQHVRMQSAFQKYGSSGVSKTINIPESASVQNVEDAYMLAWETGCKGITVYRDGSKSVQVLNTKSKTFGIGPATRPKEVECDIFKTRADGIDWHVIVGKVNNSPYELFAINGQYELPQTGRIIKKKKRNYTLVDDNGAELVSNIIEEEEKIHPRVSLETRRFSLELRHGIHPRYIVDQIDKSHDVITSFSKACSRIMRSKYVEPDTISDVCPNCASIGKQTPLINESGCCRCLENCGYSKCG